MARCARIHNVPLILTFSPIALPPSMYCMKLHTVMELVINPTLP